MAATEAMVRSIHLATRIPGCPAPHDTAHVRVHYPAVLTGAMEERMSGVLPADDTRAPFPVLVWCNGINVMPDQYRWLAERLAPLGIATVTYSWVGELFPGVHGLTPGVDLDAIRPDTYGSAPPCPAIGPVLEALGDVPSPLAGMLDLDRVALGGHSAGGTVAIESADPRWVPGLRGVVTYGAHTMAAEQLGWAPGTVLPAPAAVATLLLGGTADGVMAASAVRYGESDDAGRVDPVVRTFETALRGDDGRSHLVLLDGADHFAVVDPLDHTTGRSFLDGAGTMPAATARRHLGDVIEAFLAAEVLGDGTGADSLAAWASSPPPWAATWRRR